MDPAEFRRRNYTRIAFHTIPSGNEYDSGNYEATLDKALEIAGYDKLRDEQSRARAEGRLFESASSTLSNLESSTIIFTTFGTNGHGRAWGASR
jgi:CO/xanthine dehydrogenase Mo-binding subunit